MPDFQDYLLDDNGLYLVDDDGVTRLVFVNGVSVTQLIRTADSPQTQSVRSVVSTTGVRGFDTSDGERAFASPIGVRSIATSTATRGFMVT